MQYLTFYLDAAEEHRWSLQGGNREHMASPDDGYGNLADAVTNAAAVLSLDPLELAAAVNGLAQSGPVMMFRLGRGRDLDAAVQVRSTHDQTDQMPDQTAPTSDEESAD